MGEEFLVQTSYPGYVFVGWAAGRFENEQKQKTPYANMFVLSVSASDKMQENAEEKMKDCGGGGEERGCQ